MSKTELSKARANLDFVIQKVKFDINKRPIGKVCFENPVLSTAHQRHLAGDYRGAIELVKSIRGWEDMGDACRAMGHAEYGLNNLHKALMYHKKALELHRGNDDKSAQDEVNISSVYKTKGEYEYAVQSAKRAIGLAPDMFAPWLSLIAALNCGERFGDLDSLLSQLLEENPDLLDNPEMKDFLENDSDFIGINERIEKMTTTKKEGMTINSSTVLRAVLTVTTVALICFGFPELAEALNSGPIFYGPTGKMQ